MNKDGQAYSTFKLLIAAIIAMAILAILVPIILDVLNIIKSDPSTEATTTLNDIVDKPGTLKHTKEVIFEPDSTIAGASLANKLPISKDQICMSLGDFEDDSEFAIKEENSEYRIMYNGSSDRAARLALICNTNLDALEDDFAFYDNVFEGYDMDCDLCMNVGKCCALILRRSV